MAETKPFRAKRGEIIAARYLVERDQEEGVESDPFVEWLAEGAPPEKAPPRDRKITVR